MSLYTSLFYSQELKTLFEPQSEVNYMLSFEAALADAQAREGLIPAAASDIIKECCHADFIDIDSLIADCKMGGNAAIPLVKQLTRIVKNVDVTASKYVHFGATSQDVIDTATILIIKNYYDWLEQKISDLMAELLRLTHTYRDTVMVGRTLLQQAKPITFGLKTAQWLTSVAHSNRHLLDIKDRLLKIQLGGAVGGGNNAVTSSVRAQVATTIGLQNAVPWQSNRSSLNEWAALLGVLNGSLGKIARDVSLLMQTEVGEVFESAAEGKGGSSTMPHKRNPVTSAAIIANATRVPHLVATLMTAMPQEYERSAGLWHAEWEVLTDVMNLTAGSIEKAIELMKGLEVDEAKMRSNLEITKGLIYAENVALALADKIGKIQAHEYVEKACKLALAQDKHLLEVLQEQHIDLAEVEKLFDPTSFLTSTLSIIDETLSAYEL